MKEISVLDVIKNLKISFFYLVVGCFLGLIFGFFLFFVNKPIYQQIIALFIKRTTFGVEYLGSYKLWFILNNLIVTFLIVASALLITTIVFSEKRMSKFFRRFERAEKSRPKMILFSLYIIPIGSLITNGFPITLLLVYTLLNFGFQEFEKIFLFLIPHGMCEILGLLFSSALVLTYLKVLKPYILTKKWEEVKKISKKLLFSKTTVIFILLITLLIVFSGLIEGSLVTLIQ
jgi:hypothetical protein